MDFQSSIHEFIRKIKKYVKQEDKSILNKLSNVLNEYESAYTDQFLMLLDRICNDVINSPETSATILNKFHDKLFFPEIPKSQNGCRLRSGKRLKRNIEDENQENICLSSDDEPSRKRSRYDLNDGRDSINDGAEADFEDELESVEFGFEDNSTKQEEERVDLGEDADSDSDLEIVNDDNVTNPSQRPYKRSATGENKADVIEIDSSDEEDNNNSDDDIEEIRFEKPKQQQQQEEDKRNIIASIPFTVQFPTAVRISNRMIKGTVCLARGRNIRIKLDGIDPRTFRWDLL